MVAQCHEECTDETPSTHNVTDYSEQRNGYDVRTTSWIHEHTGWPDHRSFRYYIRNTGSERITDLRICFELPEETSLSDYIITEGDEGEPGNDTDDLHAGGCMVIPSGWSWRFDGNCIVFEAHGDSGIPPGEEFRFKFHTPDEVRVGIATVNVSYWRDDAHQEGDDPAEVPGPLVMALAPQEPITERGTILITGDFYPGVVNDLATTMQNKGHTLSKFNDAKNLTVLISRIEETKSTKRKVTKSSPKATKPCCQKVSHKTKDSDAIQQSR